MSAFVFNALSPPYPRWMGPFSPARGVFSGFRFHAKRLGTWVWDGDTRSFWAVKASAGAGLLARTVLQTWRGGRVLLLPDGLVIKPLQTDTEVGKRVVIGTFTGALLLEIPGGGTFDLGDFSGIRPGDEWCGPKLVGLECAIQRDGALRCSWYHPTPRGRDEVNQELSGPNRELAAGFRAARPGVTGGRVRVTANGLVITNRQASDGDWIAHYVGRVNASTWHHDKKWIEGGLQ